MKSPKFIHNDIVCHYDKVNNIIDQRQVINITYFYSCKEFKYTLRDFNFNDSMLKDDIITNGEDWHLDLKEVVCKMKK